ncbi:MAG: cell envelope integrity protein TolA [Burkholderiales bacterium]
MNTAVMSSRDPFMPRSAQRNGPALGLALFAHVLLIAALAFGVNWRTSEPTTVAAELWSATPQAAAPRAVEPPPPPPTPVRKPEPEPVAKPEPAPKPQAPALPDPQIAIEKAKREEAKRQQAEEEAREKKAEKAQRAKEELAQKKAAAEKLKAETEKADKLAKEKTSKADAAKQAAAREAYLKRMQGLAGATGGPTDTGSALRSSAPSASYAGRIMARIKPNIVLTEPVDGNPMATVEVKLAPDGTIVGKRLVKSSGSKAWDDAVLRAIERTEILPRDTDGRVRTPFEIDFRPRD